MHAPAEAVKSPTFDSAPVTGWRRMLRDTSLVGVSGLVCHALGAVTAILFRMCLSPLEMGIWQTLKMILGYVNFANLGVSKGATRDFTIALGRGDTREETRGLNCAFAVNTLSSMIYGAVPILTGVWLLAFSSSTTWGLGLVAVGIMAIISRYVTFHVNLLRCQQAFDKTAWISIWEAIATLAIGGGCAFAFGLNGLLAGTLLVLGLSVLLVRRFATIHLIWAWDGPRIGRLIWVGAPILLAGCAAMLFRSVDKMMILAYLPDGEFQLGCYSVALMVSAQVLGIGNLLATVMGPRYGEKYGRTDSPAVVAHMAMRATEMQAFLVAGIAAASLIIAPPVLEFLLPAYRPGFDSVHRLVFGAVGLSLAIPASQYLVVINRQRCVLLTVCVAVGAAVLGNHLVLTSGGRIAEVATVTALCYLVYWLALGGLGFIPTTSLGEWLSHLATVAAVTAGPLLVVESLPNPTSATLSAWIETALAKSLVAAGLFLVSAFVLFKRISPRGDERFWHFLSRILHGRASDD